MKRQNENGFSIIEVLLIIVVLVVIGGIGYLVYKDHHKNSPTTATTASNKTAANTPNKNSSATSSQSNLYAGWQSYSNIYVSFKYPSKWQAGLGQDKYTTTDTNITSSGFTSSAVATTDNPNAPVTISLQISTDGDIAPSCTDYTCQVTAVVALNNPQLPNSSLAIVNQTSPNGTNFTQYVVVGSATKVDSTTISPSKFGSNALYIFGQPYYMPEGGGLTEAARVTDATAIQSTTTFKDLINLINSIKFNQ